MGLLVSLLLLANNSYGDLVTIESRSAELSTKYGISQPLILAIIEVESNYNPQARGLAGEIGLMQLHPRYHKNVPTDINGNMERGVAYLAYLKTRCKPKLADAWFLCYNLGIRKALALDSPKQFVYYKKVRKAYDKAKESIQAGLSLSSRQGKRRIAAVSR